MQQGSKKLGDSGIILQRRMRQYALSRLDGLQRLSPAPGVIENYAPIKVKKRRPYPILFRKKEFASLCKRLHRIHRASLAAGCESQKGVGSRGFVVHFQTLKLSQSLLCELCALSVQIQVEVDFGPVKIT